MAGSTSDKLKRKSSKAGLSSNQTSNKKKAAMAEEAPPRTVVDERFAAEASDSESDSDTDSEETDIETKLPGENRSERSTEDIIEKQGKPKYGANPTNTEMLALNETSLVFKSNLFKLQVEELLRESQVIPNSKKQRALDGALQQIRDTLIGIDTEVEAQTLQACINQIRRLSKKAGAGSQDLSQIPFPEPMPHSEMPITFSFKAPSLVNVVGSYPLEMSVRTRTGFTVDVMAQMPSAIFEARDHLNYRFFYKRAYYVAMLMAGLRESTQIADMFDFEYENVRGDARLVAIIMRPKREIRNLSKTAAAIRVIPTIAHDTFPLARLMPTRNHVRPAFISKDGTTEEAEFPPTPQYNAMVVSNALMPTHMKYLHETVGMCGEFARASALLRVWLAQRDAGGRKIGDSMQVQSARRINGFVVTMILAHLVRDAQLSSTLGAYQLFKGAIEFIAGHDFSESPIGGTEFCKMYDAVFVDPTGAINLLANVQPWELVELRLEARRTAFDMNQMSGQDRFSHVFLQANSGDIVQKYDHLFKIKVNVAQFLAPKSDVAKRLLELELGGPVNVVQDRIARFLRNALASRVVHVAVHAVRAAFEESRATLRMHEFVVGIVADADAARALVHLGPNPDAQPKEAAEYRAYWGAKAELRRFRDGAIRLATVWGTQGVAFEQRAAILPRMVAFLLRRHFDVRTSPEVLAADDLDLVDKTRPKAAICSDTEAAHQHTMFCLSTQFDSFIRTRDENEPSTFEAAIRALDALQRELKDLEDQLPLRITALHPVAPGLRYASVRAPKAVDSDDSFIEPLDVVVEFEGSTRWPDEITAIHKIKAAFLLRLAECYHEAHADSIVQPINRFCGYGAADGLLTGISPAIHGSSDNLAFESDNCVDIRHAQSGLTFRLSLLCPREGAVLERSARDLRAANLTARALAVEAAQRRWERTHVWRAQHHRQILDLCQRHHPAASLTIRLLKRWLAQHMLLGQSINGVSDEAAELLAAHVFTDTEGAPTVPATGYAGFVRVLRVLSDWAWNDDVFVVDFDADHNSAPNGIWAAQSMDASAFALIQSAFFKTGGWRIATTSNPAADWWGVGSPLLTRRLRSLARASLACIDRALADGNASTLPSVFTAPLDDYDFVIRLDPAVVCRKYEQPPRDAFAVNAEPAVRKSVEVFKNLLPQASNSASSVCHPNPFMAPGIVGFDPIDSYVRDLVDVYHDSIVFFNDRYGGNVVAGLWNPAKVNRDITFNAKAHANVEPIDGNNAKSKRPVVAYNKSAVVDEIVRLGEGLIKDFVIQK